MVGFYNKPDFAGHTNTTSSGIGVMMHPFGRFIKFDFMRYDGTGDGTWIVSAMGDSDEIRAYRDDTFTLGVTDTDGTLRFTHNGTLLAELTPESVTGGIPSYRDTGGLSYMNIRCDVPETYFDVYGVRNAQTNFMPQEMVYAGFVGSGMQLRQASSLQIGDKGFCNIPLAPDGLKVYVSPQLLGMQSGMIAFMDRPVNSNLGAPGNGLMLFLQPSEGKIVWGAYLYTLNEDGAASSYDCVGNFVSNLYNGTVVEISLDKTVGGGYEVRINGDLLIDNDQPTDILQNPIPADFTGFMDASGNTYLSFGNYHEGDWRYNVFAVENGGREFIFDVKDEDGAAVSDFLMTALDAAGNALVRELTYADGKVVVSGDNAFGVAGLRVEKAGFAPVTLDFGESEVTLKKYYDATISVLEGDVALGEGVSVTLSVDGVSQTVTTDAQGRISLTGLSGSVHVKIEKVAGYQTAAPNEVTFDRDTLTAATKVSGKEYQVNVKILFGDAPVANAEVVYTVNGATRTATTSSEGLFQADCYDKTAIEVLSVGGYRNLSGNSFSVAGVDQGKTYNVTLTDKNFDVTLTFKDGTTLLSDVEVKLTVAGGAEQTLRTNASGEIVLAAQHDGVKIVVSSIAGYHGLSGGTVEVAVDNAAFEVQATEKYYDVTLTFKDGTTLLSDADVKLTVAGGAVQTLRTDANGKIVLENQYGTVNVVVSEIAGYESLSGGTIAATLGAAAFEVEARNKYFDVTLTFKDGDAPLADVEVKLTVGGAAKTLRTDADGKIVFADKFGAVSVTVSGIAGYKTVTGGTIAASAAACDFAVKASDKYYTARITVKDASGAAISGATVTLTSADGETVTAVADASGVYVAENLAGAYTLTVTLDGYVTESRSVSIDSSECTVLVTPEKPAKSGCNAAATGSLSIVLLAALVVGGKKWNI